MKRCVVMVLAVFMLMSMSVGVYASTFQPFASEVAASASATISRSDSKISGTGKLSANASASKLCITSIILYEKKAGSTSWVSVASESNISKENATSVSKSVSYTGKINNQYKCTVKGYITANGKTSNISDTSNVYTYK